MRPRNSIGTLLLVLALSACASTSLARLEHERQATPGSFAVNRSLGIAYFRAGRYTDARAALETASRLEPRDGTTALYLGLTAEELGDLPAARTAYASYLDVGRTSRVRLQLQSRLAALAKRELAADAKAAVQRENAVGGIVGAPTTVAVMPLRFTGADSSLRPLERGIAELLTTDLARSSKLTVVERSRIQALLDELARQHSGQTDAATTVRTGKLLRAGRVVQGSILQLGGSQLRLDAAIVDVPTTQISGTAQGADQLERLFDLEKRIALDLFRELGVTLTIAERNAVEQRPTRSLTAFLAYSRGLASEDQGRYDEAGRFYRDAIRLDPGFGAAMQKRQEARAVIRGTDVSTKSLEAGLRGTSEGAAAGTRGGGADAAVSAREAAGDLNPSAAGAATSPGGGGEQGPPQRDPVSAATNTDAVGRAGRVTIVITRPKI
ncbi:MAG TPA: tetratricopeptide repeat protein [Gemmatimonadaceae bacterium]|nr:tetratricopeptide repeat protein [Gemmatimonadaceae bacterium]